MNRITDSIPGILSRLNDSSDTGFSAFLGFDACIDSIVKVVRDKTTETRKQYFNTSTEFGEFLIRQNNKSCGVELDTKISKIGGNMVITGNALGNLGIKTDCVGTFGLPEILPFFHTMSGNCSLYTVAEYITATALEFNDSKVIVFDPGPYDKLSWPDIKRLIGLDKLKEMIAGKHLVSFLNWSEIERSSEIWQGFIDEVLARRVENEQQCDFFTDLSDCSRRSKEEIQSIPGLLKEFSKHFRVTLSLNQHEAGLVADALGIDPGLPDGEFLKKLHNAFNTDIIVLHRIKDALAYDGTQIEQCDTFFCPEPVVLTGGGDNFNAGFCLGLLHDMDIYQCLLMANAVAGAYVSSGISPSIKALIEFLENHNVQDRKYNRT